MLQHATGTEPTPGIVVLVDTPQGRAAARNVWQPLQRSWKSWAPFSRFAFCLSALLSLISCCPQADTPTASAAASESVAIFRELGMRRRILSGPR